MEALWWHGNENELSFRKEISEPKMESEFDVKIKVAYSGICGSDFHFMKNEMGKFSAKSDGVILGHEFSGTVVDLGKAASDTLKIGDKVVVNPNDCCGNCDWSTTNEPQFCEQNVGVGIGMNGGWAQYCVAPLNKVYRLSDTLDLQQGALAEPYSCVLRGWKRLEPFSNKESKILVQGGGIIGVLFCTLFHHHQFKNITVSEPNEERRKICQDLKLGLDVVHPQEIELQLAGKDSDTYGYKVIIDCTGNPTAVELAFEIASRGAKILVFGCCPAGKKMSVNPFQIYWKELTILGSFINPFCFDETIQLMRELSGAGYLEYEKLGIKEFKLQNYQEAIESLKSGKATKAIFNLES